MKKSNWTTELAVCSTVPQSNTSPRDPPPPNFLYRIVPRTNSDYFREKRLIELVLRSCNVAGTELLT